MMSVQAVQGFIYRNFVQRPRVNRALDGVGNHLNRLLDRLGIQKRYATGLTRNKAILFASNDPTEIQIAREKLLASGKAQGTLAVAHKILANNHCRHSEEIITRAVLGAKLTPKQTVDFFEKIVEEFNGWAWFVFQSLPAALEKKLTPERHIVLCREINKIAGGGVSRADLDVLCTLLKAKINPERVVTLFRVIYKGGRIYGWKSPPVMSAIPPLVENLIIAGLKQEEILSLLFPMA
jgi:hypothetical protein